ncbi:hypothetical protein [Paenibacillus baekrokdamisoli]|uniref:hypothetical protein n=1 Tax=Paenibacillus baekrokdamisoli TaxID=1712516 RepID=UPI001C85E041|nr:hypothetical protein [Paenibacillus baekrokdamisoli]
MPAITKPKRSGRNRSEEAIAFAFVSVFLPLRDRIKKSGDNSDRKNDPSAQRAAAHNFSTVEPF